MNAKFSVKSLAGLACVAALALGASSAAQAHGDDIFWSIGMSSPGVQIGMSNAPVVVQPPVIYAPAPVIYAPRPVIYSPPPPVYRVYPGYYGRGRWAERHERDDDRWEGRRDHERHDRDGREGRHYEGEREAYGYGRAPNLGRR